MSTFDGHVKEFPEIRIDYFRPTPNSINEPPPLAYFLSHVHSDHLTGLESCRSPFIYCSPGTRDILLRLEKYPHRMNFAKGILESRRQTYGHLRKLLKAVPLETPTTIELAPGKQMKVSLFDANHCVGAVSFLIEGDGKAVFYSGDVRAEAWWVEALVRGPLVVPFTREGGRRLDCMYLDTTFATSGDGGRYREFPAKAEGLRELVGKVGEYPGDTVFYYDAWTFGYEDVWQTLSTVLNTQVHVDDYRYGLYRALKNGIEPKAPETTKLVGFNFGNHYQEGCLTDQWTRLHSCEQGTGCKIWEKDFVRITPIISRHNGVEMQELGAGGGKGDLNPKHELEFGDAEMILQMLEAHEAKFKGQPGMLSKLWRTVAAAVEKGAQALDLDVLALGLGNDSNPQSDEVDPLEDLSLEKLLPALAQWLQKGQQDGESAMDVPQPSSRRTNSGALPRQITFPYSRHSSYTELSHLIGALKPRDIHPCTVDSVNWDPSHSMRELFGHLYSDSESSHVAFEHDRVMLENMGTGIDLQPDRPYRKRRRRSDSPERQASPSSGEGIEWEEAKERQSGAAEAEVLVSGVSSASRSAAAPREPSAPPEPAPQSPPARQARTELTDGEVAYAWRKEVHDAALGTHGRRWEDVELVSIAGHQTREVEM